MCTYPAVVGVGIAAINSLITGPMVAGILPNGSPLDQATYNGLCVAKGYPGTIGTFVA
jgi:hypothetical protein